MAKFAAVAAPIIGGYYFLSGPQAVLNGYNATAIALVGVVAGVLAVAHFARKLNSARSEEAAVPAEAPTAA